MKKIKLNLNQYDDFYRYILKTKPQLIKRFLNTVKADDKKADDKKADDKKADDKKADDKKADDKK
jgi:hypothetical protein